MVYRLLLLSLSLLWTSSNLVGPLSAAASNLDPVVPVAQCPGDSFYDAIAEECVCRPDCPPKPTCSEAAGRPLDSRLEVLHKGKGVAGFCCDDFACVPVISIAGRDADSIGKKRYIPKKSRKAQIIVYYWTGNQSINGHKNNSIKHRSIDMPSN